MTKNQTVHGKTLDDCLHKATEVWNQLNHLLPFRTLEEYKTYVREEWDKVVTDPKYLSHKDKIVSDGYEQLKQSKATENKAMKNLEKLDEQKEQKHYDSDSYTKTL